MKTNISGLNVWTADGEDRDRETLGKSQDKAEREKGISRYQNLELNYCFSIGKIWKGINLTMILVMLQTTQQVEGNFQKRRSV